MIAPHLTLFLMRHGETVWNTERRFQGRMDSPLTERGREQARANGRLLATHIDIAAPPRFVSSPSGRARQTMEILLETLGLPTATYETDERLVEIHMGEWEGMSWDEMQEHRPEQWAARERDRWNIAAPGGEASFEVAERAADWMKGLTQNTVAVSHGTTGRVIRGTYLGLKPGGIQRLRSPQDCIFRLSGGEIVQIES
jgi:broad specificity phosphatase PhoE